MSQSCCIIHPSCPRQYYHFCCWFSALILILFVYTSLSLRCNFREIYRSIIDCFGGVRILLLFSQSVVVTLDLEKLFRMTYLTQLDCFTEWLQHFMLHSTSCHDVFSQLSVLVVMDYSTSLRCDHWVYLIRSRFRYFKLVICAREHCCKITSLIKSSQLKPL